MLTLKKNIACYVSDACENIRTRPERTTKEHDFICSGSSPAIPELCLRKVVVIYNELINRSIDQSRYLPLIFFLTCITNELYAASAAGQQYTPYLVGLWVLWSNEHGFRCSSHGVRIDHKIRILPRHHSPGIPSQIAGRMRIISAFRAQNQYLQEAR